MTDLIKSFYKKNECNCKLTLGDTKREAPGPHPEEGIGKKDDPIRQEMDEPGSEQAPCLQHAPIHQPCQETRHQEADQPGRGTTQIVRQTEEIRIEQKGVVPADDRGGKEIK